MQQPQKSPSRDTREKLLCRKFELLAGHIGIGKIYRDVDVSRIRPEEDVVRYVENIEENIEAGKGLILSGSFGCGKTTILSYIARKAFEVGRFEGTRDGDEFIPMRYNQKFDIAFTSVHNLLTDLMNGRKIKQYEKADLLLLDDFGWEYQHEYPATYFRNFMEDRYANMRATCVTTNLGLEQLRKSEAYAHTVDRWRDSKVFDVVVIDGPSQRPQN